jgi:penicillin-insensitive murein endopeptidase
MSRSSAEAASLLLLLLLGACASAPPSAEPAKPNPWPLVRTPSAGPAESIGAHAAGCLRGAVDLPEKGPGFVTVRRSRKRHFGHPAMIRFLEAVGAEVRAAHEPAFMVGDVGLPRGGPTLSGHASHQTGLDVDLWYWRPARRLGAEETETLNPPTLVDAKARSVIAGAMKPGVVGLVRRFAERPEVDRIFVNYSIKRWLCQNRRDEPWIRKTRAWFGHDRHFHVRLACPPGETRCAAGDPIPEGDGCDATLEWWWSDEAREQEAAKSTTPPEMPKLPEACAEVLAL